MASWPFSVHHDAVRPSWRFRRGLGAATVVLLTLLTGVTGQAIPAGASVAQRGPAVGPVEQPAAVAPTSLEAPDEAAAMALAYRTRKPIEVTGLTSETTKTWALPDGTFKSEVHLAPVRTRDDTGAWVDVDLNLERKSDGSIGPKAHPRGLWFSGARSASTSDLVALGRGAEQVTLGWRGALPEPVLDGTKATYVNVRPGVDLVLEVGRTGYQYSFTVKTPQAAADLATIPMPWETGALTPTARAAGSEMTLRSAAGSSLVISEATMWDARVSPETGEPVHRADVAVSTEPSPDGGTDLVLTPDPGFFDDPQITYPVTIDPWVHLDPAFDAYVQDNILNSDKSHETELKLGYVDDASRGCADCTARSFLSFHHLSGYWGATVVSAELLLWNEHSWSCSPASWEAWRTSYVTTSARWNNQPDWLEHDGTSTGTKGYGGCDPGWVSVSVKKTFQHSFTTQSSTANVGLRASNENNHNGWKKFRSTEASWGMPWVDLRYNRTPSVPTRQTIDSCYVACTSPATVRSGTPTISARLDDPDGGTLRAEYEVFDNAKTTMVAKSGTAVTGVTSGTARGWQVVPTSGSTLPDGTYHWRVRGCDSYTCGDYSPWFTFTVNTQDVSLPTVTATPYAERSTGTWNGGPGQPGTFTFGPNGATDVAEYVYMLNDGNAVTVPAGTPQAEMLTANQQTVSTDLTGFTAGGNANLFHSSHGHDGAGSLRVNPNGTGDTPGAEGDTYATLGGDRGGFRLGMQPGKRYHITGWIWVPATTGLNPTGTFGEARGQRIVAISQVATATYAMFFSQKATITEGWQQLSVVMSVPANAQDAYVRLYNGMPTGSGKHVYWDDLSVREVTGTTTVQTITPTRDGANVLSVQSRNTVGVTSDPKVYQFLVTPSTNTWNWTFDQNTGTSTASVPDTRPASLSSTGVAWTSPGRVGAGAMSFDGTGDLTTSSPVLDTNGAAGFTVAAWVRLTELNGTRTAVSQDGVNSSMFELGFRDDHDLDGDTVNDPAWCFTVKHADTTGTSSSTACTTDLVIPGDWVALVGVHDRPNNKIQLYVGAGDWPTVVEITHTGGWSSAGSFAIGRAWHDAAVAERWLGDIDHVYAVQKAWSEPEALAFMNPQ